MLEYKTESVSLHTLQAIYGKSSLIKTVVLEDDES
jgi:hypothetical protein